MTCAACAARIEKNLNQLEGVKASVNLASERATVRSPRPGVESGARRGRDGAKLRVGRFQLADAQPMATALLKIEGMSCEGCVQSVTRTLHGVAGVQEVEVSLAQANARPGYEAR